MTDLKTLALAANSAHPCTSWYDSESLIYMGYDDDCDASYIAVASPDAILALLAANEQWEVDFNEEVIMRRNAEAERDRLREALAQITEVQRSPIGDSKAFKVIGEIARQALATDSP